MNNTKAPTAILNDKMVRELPPGFSWRWTIHYPRREAAGFLRHDR